jgi:hypothetical protein
MTNYEISELLDCNEQTLYVWAAKHKDFSQALKAGKDPADDRVERSLYHRATGYTRKKIVKKVDENGVEQEHEVIEHVPPDVTACIFWLKNRRRQNWRDRPDDDGSGGTVTVRVTGGFVKDQPVESNGEPSITVTGGIPKDEQK